jgi:hypothetical protein
MFLTIYRASKLHRKKPKVKEVVSLPEVKEVMFLDKKGE